MSDEALYISVAPAAGTVSRAGTAAAGAQGAAASKGARSGAQSTAAPGETVTLSPAAKALVTKLQARDADVRAHEAAHIAVGGDLVTSGANFTYEKGPDGKLYAIGGEVTINTSPVPGNPKATEAKARQIEAAALAPKDPSSQDEAVAAEAAAMAAQAAAQLAQGGNQGTPGSAQTPGGTKGTAQAASQIVNQAYGTSSQQAGGSPATQPGSLVNTVA